MTKISVAIEKGGVGKTASVWNIGAGLSKRGKKVLLVDIDQQNHLSRLLGYQQDKKPTIIELIYQEVSKIKSNNYQDFIRYNLKDDIEYIPANKMLGGIYSILGADGESNTVLTRIFNDDFFKKYDYILFDCPTAVDNLLVSNVLQCCDKLLMPVQAELLAYEGVPPMLQKIMAVKQENNIQNHILGLLVTMYRVNTNMSKEVLNALSQSYGDLVFKTTIPFLQEAKNCTETKLSLVNDKKSKIGNSYLEIVDEIIKRSEK